MFGLERLDAEDECVDDACMEQSIVVDAEVVGIRVEGRRRWRAVEEKRRIVEEAMASGASVAQVARPHAVNANQVFLWRVSTKPATLCCRTVIVADSVEQGTVEAAAESCSGSIHIEFAGRALVTIEAGVDPALVVAVIERLAR